MTSGSGWLTPGKEFPSLEKFSPEAQGILKYLVDAIQREGDLDEDWFGVARWPWLTPEFIVEAIRASDAFDICGLISNESCPEEALEDALARTSELDDFGMEEMVLMSRKRVFPDGFAFALTDAAWRAHQLATDEDMAGYGPYELTPFMKRNSGDLHSLSEVLVGVLSGVAATDEEKDVILRRFVTPGNTPWFFLLQYANSGQRDLVETFFKEIGDSNSPISADVRTALVGMWARRDTVPWPEEILIELATFVRKDNLTFLATRVLQAWNSYMLNPNGAWRTSHTVTTFKRDSRICREQEITPASDIAATTNLADKVARAIAADGSCEALLTLMKNPTIPTEIIEEAARKYLHAFQNDQEVMEKAYSFLGEEIPSPLLQYTLQQVPPDPSILQSPAVDEQYLAEQWKSGFRYIEFMASNPNCPEWIIREAYEELRGVPVEDAEPALTAIAQNVSTPADIMIELVKHKSYTVRNTAAAYGPLTPETVRAIRWDPGSQLFEERLFNVLNRLTFEQILETQITSLVYEALSFYGPASYKTFKEKGTTSAKLWVLNEAADPHGLPPIFGSGVRSVFIAAALVHDKSEAVRKKAILLLPPGVLPHLLSDTDPSVRAIALTHPGVTANQIEKALNDASGKVKNSAVRVTIQAMANNFA